MISDSLYNYLSNNAGVSALVGTRIFPLVIPQQSYDEATKQPCLVYTMDTDQRQVRFAGSDTLVRGRLTVDCYATRYIQSQALAAAARSALIDFSGSMQAATSPLSSVSVQRIFLDNETSLTDENPGLYRVMQRYIVWYDES
jgi:hypothetical protein